MQKKIFGIIFQFLNDNFLLLFYHCYMQFDWFREAP